jgi:regulator of sigma E protease
MNLPPDHPLAIAGLESGDKLLSVNGVPTENGISAFLEFESHLGQEVTVIAMRNRAEQVAKVMLPGETNGPEVERFLGGLHFATKYYRENPATSFVAGVKKSEDIVVLIFKTIGMLFSGKASVSDLSGPVGIATVTYQAAASGFVDLINIMILLSVNLAIFNLLPFPALDGGRMIFLIAEGIMRRPVVNVRVENLIHIAGFLLLILLALFVTYHDIARMIFSR